LPRNYRPISLTCTLCKLMELIIKDRLLCYLVSHNLISKHQHAFIQKHSTVTNVLESTHDWALTLQEGHLVDVIYIDFSRAFDSVIHRKLLLKLSCLGVNGHLLNWISAFLNGRYQCVTIDNYYSQWVEVISGVPQGSVLGPILFLLFVNDATVIWQHLSLYADDLKLYSDVSVDSNVDSLQSALDKLADWAQVWQLSINTEKTQVLHLGTNNPHKIYFLSGVQLNAVESARDLGIEIGSNYSFDIHIDSIIARAYSRIGVIFKGFVSRDLKLLKQAFTSFVRPIVEYASNVWSPYKIKHIKAIERVQRHFTRRIPGFYDLSYGERLARLNLETLEYRRLKFDLIQYYKILNNLTPFSPDVYFETSKNLRQTRSNGNQLLNKPLRKTKNLENEFFVRQIDCWNKLPLAVRQAPTLTNFKLLFAKQDLSEFLCVNV